MREQRLINKLRRALVGYTLRHFSSLLFPRIPIFFRLAPPVHLHPLPHYRYISSSASPVKYSPSLSLLAPSAALLLPLRAAIEL